MKTFWRKSLLNFLHKLTYIKIMFKYLILLCNDYFSVLYSEGKKEVLEVLI